MKKVEEKELDRLLSSPAASVATVAKVSMPTSDKDVLRNRQRAFLQSLESAIARRDKIAASITQSNAVTSLVVDGVPMTVAAAIDRKNNIEKEKAFCNLLSKASTAVTTAINSAERSIEEEASNRAQILAGRDKAVTKEALDLAKASVEDLYKLETIEPCDIFKLLIKKLESVDKFMAEVDIALNESNATTKIELDLVV